MFTHDESNEVRAAGLFAADKYRKAYEILDRFADETASDVRVSCDEFVRIAQSVIGPETVLTNGQVRLLDQAFSGYLRDVNRRLQIIAARCDVEQENALRGQFVIATAAAAKVATALVAHAPQVQEEDEAEAAAQGEGGE